MEIIRAAGGLVWRARSLAVVHRPRRRDWSLPKGKLERGESWEAAALREVEEETGCRASLLEFAGATHHRVSRGPKLVLYWHMSALDVAPRSPDDEVDEVAWLEPTLAVERLDHEDERRLAARAARRVGAAAEAGAEDLAALFASARGALLAAATSLAAEGDAGPLLGSVDLLDRADEAALEGDADAARGALALAMDALRR
jgi:8-oxo-dGTP diphosphatase